MDLARRPVVGVMGSGAEPHAVRAGQVGRWLALQGAHLLTGGGGGVMAAVSEAFARTTPRRGLCIGVLPARTESDVNPPPGYPNPWVELAIRTHLHRRGAEGEQAQSRNHIHLLSADAVVFLPGGTGTASEARLALRYGCSAVAWCETAAERDRWPAGLAVAMTFDELTDRLSALLAGHALD